MKVVIQRVSSGKVEVEGIISGQINKGLLVFLAIGMDDGVEDIDWLTDKIIKLRIFPDDKKPMNLSIDDVQGEILLISQFTLFASTKKGNRPSFTRSAPPNIAIPLYEKFIAVLSHKLKRSVATGKFGADMKVSLVNDGPVTISINSKERE